jgi:hypothetical protein
MAMTSTGYRDELIRTLARSDAAELRSAVQTYFGYSKLSAKEQESCFADYKAAIEIFLAAHDDPDLAMALVMLAASMFDDRDFLFLVAAGPLEDMLVKPSVETIDRVVAEARKNARFRWMLIGIFLHAISDQARPQIAAIIGTMTEDDPLPPRPS